MAISVASYWSPSRSAVGSALSLLGVNLWEPAAEAATEAAEADSGDAAVLTTPLCIGQAPSWKSACASASIASGYQAV